MEDRPSSTTTKSHTFESKTNGGRLRLTVEGNAELSQRTPTFTQGEPVRGMVELTTTGDSALSVSISIHGRMTTGRGPNYDFTFLTQSLVLWSRKGAKLQGAQSWPFSFDLPNEILLPGGPTNSLYSLPQTFFERHTQVRISYELVAHLARGKLRADTKVYGAFVYMPLTRPPLPSPVGDPWHTLKPIGFLGVIRGKHVAEVRCTLAFAKPLCYTRGSLLPCIISIKSSDEEALEILSSPRAIVLRVCRYVKFREVDKSSTETLVDSSESAIWWPCPTDGDSFERRLNGEISLTNSLKPSSHLGQMFRIEYTAALFPFDAPEFSHMTPYTSTAQAIIEEPIEIATSFATDDPNSYSTSPAT